jgi:MFS family permease
MIGAGLSGLLGWRFGFAAVLGLAALFGILSIISILLIPRAAIDDNAARGLGEGRTSDVQVKGIQILLECRPLMVLAACLALFHLGNAALLPLYGMAVVGAHKGDPVGFVALTIVVAQAAMIPTSLIAMRCAETRGNWWVMLITFIALPIRGLFAASLITGWGVWPVQILDGVGAGLQSVAVPGLVARLLNGTGRVNAGQGMVMAVQGAGAALSPALGGWLAQGVGYRSAFLILGALSIGSLLLWLGSASWLKPACAANATGA